MKTMFTEMGIFEIAIVVLIYIKVRAFRKEYRDCLLFSRLMLATLGILTVDTIGWLIDGSPIFGQIWFTWLIDGLDLFFTTLVCWCWVQYALYIADESKMKVDKWYRDFATILLIIQGILVIVSLFGDVYFTIDAEGVYHRSGLYLIHSLISLALLSYSSGKCLIAYKGAQSHDKRNELIFVTLIILLPIVGNVFQLYIYGFPTVWICMVLMIIIVYMHIQNRRVDNEKSEQNKVLKRALAQANSANIAKTDFLARMSHDMRTPMNGILGLTSIMEGETSVEEMKNELPKLRQSGEYLLQLINDCLDVNKVESGTIKLHPEVCDEEQLFDTIIAMVIPTMDAKNIEFNFTKKDIEWTTMYLDVQRVKQIFVNLMTNAIKFTPSGGRIDFHMELVYEDENIIKDKFIIRDTGIGMSKEFLPHVFDPFAQEHRTEEDLGGTGLGLSIVKSLVQLMGGEISVESTLNEGTTFTVYLIFPLSRETPPGNVSPVDVPLELLFPEGLNILLCEDHPINAEITKRLLLKKNANVTWAQNGKLGVDEFKASDDGYFDVVLMDIRMPVMDGLEATRSIRTLSRDDSKKIPIIAMTANAYDSDIEKSLEAGIDVHLAKPVEPKVMYETIAKLVSK